MENLLDAFVWIFSISVVRYFVIAGLPFLLCYKVFKNWLSQSKIQARTASRADLVREILHSVQTTFVFCGDSLFNIVYACKKYHTSVYAYNRLPHLVAFCQPTA